MNSNTLVISGFKCFANETTFSIRQLTAVTGSNGTGKSSFIQALLLIRLAIEKNARTVSSKHFIGTEWDSYPIPLNNQYELALGTIYDIFNEKGLVKDNIRIVLGEEEFLIPLPEAGANERSAIIKLENPTPNFQEVPFWRKQEFYYLCAERLGPRHALQSNYTEFISVGHKGEFTAQVILDKGLSFRVEQERMFGSSKGETLSIQVNEWLNYLCPGVNLRVEPLGSMSARLLLRNGSSNKDTLATNMGFGVSYSLPIIVTGLIAVKGSAFIIENPEAHLHPKGQSNMGYFLGRMAISGVKVIIETHSEHIINGIRRALVENKNFIADDISLYFFDDFSKGEKRIEPISVYSNGDLSNFPVDFFDQTRQDLLEIIKLGRVKNG